MTSSRRQILGSDISATSYRSAACQIGTHQACAESTPDLAPVDLPLIYEACGCLCHAVSGQPWPGGDAANSTSSGMPALNIEATEGRVKG
ncbi:predicted protein [Streptomyces azureus]|uniref:Uncharacterized protein n=1 Tax=Streptomyces azureus TaxID=146537 RepID=A0A0K8PW65_STRAJ|nr:predicted protein [Streptomyces azureus]